MNEQGRENTTKSYMWVARGGLPGHMVVLFSHAPARSGREVPLIPGNFTGFLQTDGYRGYEAMGRHEGITHVACLAHVRRKFVEAARSGKKNSTGTATKIAEPIAHNAFPYLS